MRVLTVSTVNVNGIRAAAAKGFTEWLKATPADVVCLQEVRAEPDQFPADLRAPEGWHTLVAPAAAKGRAGVALFSRVAPTTTRIGFGTPEFDTAGRYAEMHLPTLTIASLYLPTGEVGTERQAEKERFMAGFHAHLSALSTEAAQTGRAILICGDWNIAHDKADIKNWRANQKSSGFLPEERQWLTSVLTEAGYADVVRNLHPGVDGPYSWWSFRGKAFDNDTGWRIDYQMASANLAALATSAKVERAATYAERWSDHAPVTCAYDWDLAAVPAPRSPISIVGTELLEDSAAAS
ncbi:exodeoxyribonuclease III Xth [Catenulispora acidiphila DSM 44928]|uniref:Exodeoxyribonuclease III Xth n=1 Tax=Catenulispora acidiphila (strain DSM 44928 / JCM 14897 / NBRC 102108 / NRRL B-24433 / ID139908) TaxID=479433 RepID=C7QCF5_CATAD|nr:exodeoxyribonuclease III Xth [Catenulispora acidiphila DSM 44928]